MLSTAYQETNQHIQLTERLSEVCSITHTYNSTALSVPERHIPSLSLSLYLSISLSLSGFLQSQQLLLNPNIFL